VNQKTSRSTLYGYSLALACVVAVFALRWVSHPFLQQHAPLMLFILAVVIASWYGGLGPGLLAIVLGAVLGDFFFIPPYHTLGPRSFVEWAYCVAFMIESGTAVFVVHRLRTARMRAQRAFDLAKSRGEQLRHSLRQIGDAEARIRELAMVVDSAQDSIITSNLKGEVTSWNNGAERLFGYTAAEILGKPLQKLMPESRQGEMEELNQKLQSGQPIAAFETVRLAKDGHQVDVSVSLSPMHDSDGQLSGASAITRDITPIKRANAALRKSEQKFQALADAAPLMICEMDSRQNCTWVNKSWLIFTGRALDQQLDHGWMEAIHPDDRAQCLEAQKKAFENRQPFEFEYRLRRADGEYRWMFERAVPHFSPDNVLLGYLRSCLDVTERKKAEEALEKKFDELRAAQRTLQEQNQQLAAGREALDNERSRYRELFNSAPVGYIITNPQGVIQQVNAAAAMLLNETSEMLEGLPFARLLSKEARPLFFARLSRLTRQEADTVESWETTIQPHERALFCCSLLANRVADSQGTLTGLRWIVRDISERKQTEERILRLNAELEQHVRQRTAALETANRELEAFSYSVSHDLRAPVRSIIGFSKALLEDYSERLDAEGLKFLQYAYEAGLRMSRLIDDLIELSRSTRGELRQKEVDLSALAMLVTAELRNRDPSRSVEVNIAAGLFAHGDEGLLRIALENLFSNAWKFTSRQSHPMIEFGATDQNSSTLFYVRDNGAGFNMAHAKRLFGVFQRLHSPEEFPGTGIGLATVRRIFTRHGGEIWANAEPNQGATFFFTLPNGLHTAALEQERKAA
jgi:PAS domain S-box-containing protein